MSTVLQHQILVVNVTKHRKKVVLWSNCRLNTVHCGLMFADARLALIHFHNIFKILQDCFDCFANVFANKINHYQSAGS